MSVDTPQMIAVRWKRQTRNVELIALCDAVLGQAPAVAVERAVVKPSKVSGDCPVCAARRAAKAATQRKWRQGRARR